MPSEEKRKNLAELWASYKRGEIDAKTYFDVAIDLVEPLPEYEPTSAEEHLDWVKGELAYVRLEAALAGSEGDKAMEKKLRDFADELIAFGAKVEDAGR